MRPLRVLSLFDGMSCGQIALRELGYPIEKYYASEVDKFAIAQTQLNFPDTIQLGDVRNLEVDSILQDGDIDLLIAGSPCTNLSFAGKRNGLLTTTKEEIYTLDRYLELKEQGFEFEGQSYLFWEFMRIFHDLKKRNPNLLFLLENVEMGQMWEEVFSTAIGIHGVHIDAALMSAQRRKRIYWTNIRVTYHEDRLLPFSDIPQPEDRGIMLKNILETEVEEKYYLKDEVVQKLIGHNEANSHLLKNITDTEGKAHTFLASSHKGALANGMSLIVQRGVVRVDGSPKASQPDHVYSKDGKSPTLGSNHFANTINVALDFRIRRITPTECARLQTVPEWYIWNCSATQQYRLLGNGWCVEVIKHIFSFLSEHFEQQIN